MRETVRGVGLLLLFMTGAAGAEAQSLSGVDPAGAGLPLYRPSGAVAVMARATSRWIPVPTDPHDLLGVYQYLPPTATDDTEGQIFELLASEPGWDVADGEGRFVAVPWTVGCGCADEGWDQPDWVPSGDTVTFILTKTRKRVPWDGPPVYDVLGWHQPYPVGEFIPYWRWSREEPRAYLSVMDFFDFLTVLPTDVAFQLDSQSSLRAVEEWLRRNPQSREAFPIPSVLRELERRQGEEER